MECMLIYPGFKLQLVVVVNMDSCYMLLKKKLRVMFWHLGAGPVLILRRVFLLQRHPSAIANRKNVSVITYYVTWAYRVNYDVKHVVQRLTLRTSVLFTENRRKSASSILKENSLRHRKEEILLGHNHRSTEISTRRKVSGGILDINSLKMLAEKRDIFFLLSFLIHNTKPVVHQDLVGLVISMLLLGDFSLVLLTLLQFHGPRRSAGLARVYALWNIASMINVVSSMSLMSFPKFIFFVSLMIFDTILWWLLSFAGIFTTVASQVENYQTFSHGTCEKNFQALSKDESEWWIFPVALVVCKCIQSQLINWHVANLEIQDRSLYSNDFDLFWQS
ncbi:unnamed protein product [Ilex paraguariensis]|uniref:Uncharacterized protein n=1 Tax=Ilex paraguariensis TaxID=185542 RepID=A0ABC8R8N2_9AQUA